MKDHINKREQYEKEARRLLKRLNQIRKEIRNQPFVEVPPFQRGWDASIVLREDISNRKDADFILHLIDIGYQKVNHIRNIKHVKMIKQGIYGYEYKKKHDNRIVHVSFIPQKKKLSEKQYLALSDREKRYFIRYSYRNWIGEVVWYQLYIPDYWITLKVTPCLYNRIMDKNGKLEAEEALIRNKLYSPPYDRYMYRGGGHDRDRTHYKVKVQKMNLKEQLKEYQGLI